ncbi:MAG TPA: SRPBCC domain-containing protein [Pseudonocardiaceae bacterium]|nr:SRPBCC domain-containing protein [Pseudonocardiaceae bacterium]
MPADRVTQLRRPPVRQATLVRSDVAHTFAVFVRTLAQWWPLRPFSSGQERVAEVTVEERVGGRVFETWDDGTVVEWGELLEWDPPTLFTMTWHHTPKPTEVELTFTALEEKLTRVAVEHRGWEALSEAELSQDCALPGGYNNESYSKGWQIILGHLKEHVEKS